VRLSRHRTDGPHAVDVIAAEDAVITVAVDSLTRRD
jgi:hypothetical protein